MEATFFFLTVGRGWGETPHRFSMNSMWVGSFLLLSEKFECFSIKQPPAHLLHMPASRLLQLKVMLVVVVAVIVWNAC